MFKTEVMNEFFFLPQLDLGWLRRWLKVEPVRPDSNDQTAEIVAEIAEYEDREVHGDVYRLKDGRLFYAPMNGPCHPRAFEPDLDSIEGIKDPHPDILSSDKGAGSENVQPPSKLHSAKRLGIVTDPAVKAAIVRGYYGKKAQQKLIELSLA